MKKNRKIVISLIIALGLFANISGTSSNNVSLSANPTHSFSTLADDGPIGGNH